MNILVIGGLGYIGSQVVNDLLQRNNLRPIVLDNISTGHRKSVSRSVRVVKGSYGNRTLVQKVLRQYKINAVIHLGGRSLVGESIKYPETYWTENVEWGVHLVQAMQAAGVKKIIFSSSASVYGDPKQKNITETHPLHPLSPYGSSKLAIEFLLQGMVKQLGFTATSLRFFNVAGAHASGHLGEDHRPETHLIPNLFRHALGMTPAFTLYGTDYATPDGTCIRDYVDVRDISQAHLLVLQKSLKSGKTWSTYNLGSGTGYSNAQVISLAETVTGKKFKVKKVPARVGDPARLVASYALIHKRLGWKPKYNLEHMLQSAWLWHSAHPRGFV